jgi:DNA-binding XRE family transcriptional regulator
MNAQELLEAAKTHTGLSQNGLAEAIGIRQPTLSQWNAGKTELSDETYIKLAELAGVNPTEVIIEKHMRKAGPEGRKIWANLAKALPKSAALVVVFAFLTAQHQENQGNINVSKFSNLANTYYVKFLIWMLQRTKGRLKPLIC